MCVAKTSRKRRKRENETEKVSEKVSQKATEQRDSVPVPSYKPQQTRSGKFPIHVTTIFANQGPHL